MIIVCFLLIHAKPNNVSEFFLCFCLKRFWRTPFPLYAVSYLLRCRDSNPRRDDLTAFHVPTFELLYEYVLTLEILSFASYCFFKKLIFILFFYFLLSEVFPPIVGCCVYFAKAKLNISTSALS